jgi:pimeloyl-ACP methyl ester carboxylesterase
MEADDREPSRRSLIRAAGLGIGATIVAGLDSGQVRAAAAAAAAPKEDLWSHDYWAKKGEVSLYLYRKRRSAPAAGEPRLPVLFLTHGSSVSGRSSYDLTVPGAGEYSMMNVFARFGYDVWTMDFEGYGRSTVTSGNSDIKSGVEDLKAATDLIVTETGQKKLHFFGESSGALRAGAFAMARPERVDRLALCALTYTGKGSPTLEKRGEQVEYYRTHNRRKRDADMIRSIYTRDKPGTTDPRVAEAMVKAEMPFGDTVPTGTYLDMVANLPVIDPPRIAAPVMIGRGQYDGIATDADLLDFFEKLANQDRQYVIVAGAAHAIGSSYNRHKYWHMVHAFLSMPAGVAV